MTLTVPDFLLGEEAKSLDAVSFMMVGAMANKNNPYLSYNPNNDNGGYISGLESFMYPSFIKEFVTQFMGKSFSTINTATVNGINQLLSLDYKNNFVIGMVHMNDDNKISPGFQNHYLQILNFTKASEGYNINYWTWGKNFSNIPLSGSNFGGILSISVIK